VGFAAVFGVAVAGAFAGGRLGRRAPALAFALPAVIVVAFFLPVILPRFFATVASPPRKTP
jgi:hypothetical protein